MLSTSAENSGRGLLFGAVISVNSHLDPASAGGTHFYWGGGFCPGFNILEYHPQGIIGMSVFFLGGDNGPPNSAAKFGLIAPNSGRIVGYLEITAKRGRKILFAADADFFLPIGSFPKMVHFGHFWFF